MKRLLIALISTLGLSAQASLFKVPQFKSFKPMTEEQTPKTTCPALTGTWVSTCTVTDTEGNKQVATHTSTFLQAGCDAIYVDNEKFYVPGSSDKTIIGDTKSDTTTLKLKWLNPQTLNADGTYLSIDAQNGSRITVNFASKITINGSTMMTETRSEGKYEQNDNTYVFGASTVCEGTRQ